jgi:hypothetical protein
MSEVHGAAEGNAKGERAQVTTDSIGNTSVLPDCRSASESLSEGFWRPQSANRSAVRTNPHHRDPSVEAAGCVQGNQWVWSPKMCRLSRLAYQGFCGRNLAFVGDSISLQSFKSLLAALKKRSGAHCMSDAPWWGARAECEFARPGETYSWCNITLSWVSNDFLCHSDCQRPLYEGANGLRHSRNLVPLTTLLQQRSFFVGADLIFGTGLHWTSNHENINAAKRTIEPLFRSNIRACMVLAEKLNASSLHFRAIWPGHPNCASRLNQGPLLSAPAYDGTEPFRWYEILPLNRIMARECSAATKCVFHDLEPMSSLRPDAHMHWQPSNKEVDCAHWCLHGGPMEWANVVLQAHFSSKHSVR